MIPILILAAGQSSRMNGRDKLMEEVDGRPLLRRMAETALEVSETVLVTLPGLDHPRVRALDGLGVQLVPVPDAAEGLSASLKRGVAHLPDCARFVVLLADLPDLTAEDIRIVLQAAEHDVESLIWRGATAEGKAGHPTVFDTHLIPAFDGLEGDTGAQPVIAAHADRLRLVPLPDGRARRDLDTPEQWEAFRRETGR